MTTPKMLPNGRGETMKKFVNIGLKIAIGLSVALLALEIGRAHV